MTSPDFHTRLERLEQLAERDDAALEDASTPAAEPEPAPAFDPAKTAARIRGRRIVDEDAIHERAARYARRR